MNETQSDGSHSGVKTDENWRPPVHIIPDIYGDKCKKCHSLADRGKVRTSGILEAAIYGMNHGTAYIPIHNYACTRIENQVVTSTGEVFDRPVKLDNSCSLFKISALYNPEIKRG